MNKLAIASFIGAAVVVFGKWVGPLIVALDGKWV